MLTWPRIENVPSDWTLTLLDRQTGDGVDLRQFDRYAFTIVESAGREAAAERLASRSRSRPARAIAQIRRSTRFSASPRPNPVVAHATIAFSLAEAGPAHLSVVDLVGREVAVLAEGTVLTRRAVVKR